MNEQRRSERLRENSVKLLAGGAAAVRGRGLRRFASFGRGVVVAEGRDARDRLRGGRMFVQKEASVSVQSAAAFWDELEKIGVAASRVQFPVRQVRRAKAVRQAEKALGSLRANLAAAEKANSSLPTKLVTMPARLLEGRVKTAAKLTKAQIRYRAKSGNYFGGEKKVDITKEEMAAYRKRLKAAGLRSSNSGGYSNLPASLGKTVKGFAAYTHRARTKWYPTPEAIPLKKLKFIASTG
jgi:hypothetical protein